jgi:hypothetical protein
MSHRRDLRLLRHARKLVKRQQRQLAALELTGITAVTLHAHDQQVTIAVVCSTGAPFTDTLREVLRDRRQALWTETRQLLRVWLEDEQLRDRPDPTPGSQLP